MRAKPVEIRQELPAAAIAALLWFVCFYLSWANFWIKISLSAATLAAISMWLQRPLRPAIGLNGKALVEGIVSAGILYGIFWVGRRISLWALPFASNQIGAIYGKGEATPTWIVFLLLLLVTGPCEEIFWRGYLQRNLMKRLGDRKGWAAATAMYAGVHIWSFNFMLIGAAAVAGAFWGLHYWHSRRLAPVIVSHAVWSSFIFAILPLR